MATRLGGEAVFQGVEDVLDATGGKVGAGGFERDAVFQHGVGGGEEGAGFVFRAQGTDGVGEEAGETFGALAFLRGEAGGAAFQGGLGDDAVFKAGDTRGVCAGDALDDVAECGAGEALLDGVLNGRGGGRASGCGGGEAHQCGDGGGVVGGEHGGWSPDQLGLI